MKKILIVDNDINNRKFLQDILNEQYNIEYLDQIIEENNNINADLILINSIKENKLINNIFIPKIFIIEEFELKELIKFFIYDNVDFILKPIKKQELLFKINILINKNTSKNNFIKLMKYYFNTFRFNELSYTFYKSFIEIILKFISFEKSILYLFEDNIILKYELFSINKDLDNIINNIQTDLLINNFEIKLIEDEEIQKYLLKPNKHIKNMFLLPIRGYSKNYGYIIFLNLNNNMLFYYLDYFYCISLFIGLLYENIILKNKLVKENLLVKSLINISQIINSTVDYQKLLDLIINVLSNFLNIDKIILMLINKNKENLEIVRALNVDKLKIDEYNKDPIKLSEISFAMNEPEKINYLFKLDKFNKLINGLSIIIAPMILRYKLMGYVIIENTDYLDDLNIKLMKLIIDISVKSIENTYLFSKLLEQNEKLLQTTEILKNTEKKLILNEKLAAIGKFSSVVAHEIRNPLTILLSALNNFKTSTDEEKEKLLKFMEEKIFDIEFVLKEMMDIAKDIKLNYSIFEPYKSINSLVDFLKNKINNNKIKLNINFTYLGTINADKLWFERSILNLLVNALEAMKDGGILSIDLYEENNNIIIKINDTGHGIPDEIKNKIFEPFVSYKKTGSGLGLYNVKKIVDMHNGSINFNSDNNGTTFIINLPKNL